MTAMASVGVVKERMPQSVNPEASKSRGGRYVVVNTNQITT